MESYPVRRMFVPVSTPEGILTAILLEVFVVPFPLHDVHGFCATSTLSQRGRGKGRKEREGIGKGESG